MALPSPLARAPFAVATLLASVIAAAAVGFISFSVGLVLMEPYLLVVGYPAAGALTGVGAALAAAWTANLLAPDRSRTRLLPVVAASALAGVVGAFLIVALRTAMEGPMAGSLIPVLLGVALVATVAAMKRRRPRDALRRDAWTSVGLLVLIPVGLYAVVGVGCLVGQCGA